MNSILRVASLVVVSFAAASTFAADVPQYTVQAVKNGGMTAQAMPRSGGTARADLVKCTNPRECSVG